MELHNFCIAYGFDRKTVMKIINSLIELHYGSYTELINLTLQEISDIQKVIKSIEQRRAMEEAGLK